MYKKCDLNYAAAVVDIRAGITIRRAARFDTKNVYVRVKVAKSKFGVINHLNRVFGGSVCVSERNFLGRVVLKEWVLTCTAARDFLTVVLPHLKTDKKKALAELVLTYPVPGRGYNVSREMRRQQKLVEKQLRKLMKKKFATRKISPDYIY